MKIWKHLIAFIIIAISITTYAGNDGISYRSQDVDGIEIFYRQAGNPSNPTLLLLHGFPTSSHMFRNLIAELSDEFHLIAPDYPGYGRSEQPSSSEYEYTFDNLALTMEVFLEQLDINKFSLYLMDYGAPVGYRIATKYPQRVQSLIIQNGNAYEEGLAEFWDPIRTYWQDKSQSNAAPLAEFITLEGVKWQYTHGTRNETSISPDNWHIDLVHLNRDGNAQIQLDLFYDYQNNVPHYPAWQSYFREYQPPALVVWGANDYIFPAQGAHPYKRDLKDLEFHLLDTGHFALEEDGQLISNYIRDFLNRKVKG